jgi:hypothetical protein
MGALLRVLPVPCVLALVMTACSLGSNTPTPTPTVAATASAPPAIPLRVLVTRTEGGGPVAGAEVCASRASSAAPSCAKASADGTATIVGQPGTYFVRVRGPAEQRWQEATRVTDLLNGPAALWIELQPLHRISGRIRDEAGSAVAGAEACATPANDDAPTCARSGADGAYVIDAKAGIYRLEVSGAPGSRLVSQWARGRAFLEEADILDARSADVPDVDVTLVRGVVLKGTVRLAGEVVEDAQVCLRTLAAPLPWECERTDKKGQYAALREPGSYYMWVVPPANVRAVPVWYDRALTGVGASPISLAADRAIDVALPTGPQVRGVLRSDDGAPVANALVCIDTAFATGRICRETDGNGRYAITTRGDTTYVISVIPPEHSGLIGEYWDGKRTWAEADDVVVRSSDVTLDLVVERGVIVTGVVKNRRGIPVAGAFLDFSDARSVAAATSTDAAGRFEAVMRAGTYEVAVFPPFVGNLVGLTTSLDVPSLKELEIVLDDVAP